MRELKEAVKEENVNKVQEIMDEYALENGDHGIYISRRKIMNGEILSLLDGHNFFK